MIEKGRPSGAEVSEPILSDMDPILDSFDPVAAYKRELRSLRPLTKAEEMWLAQHVKARDSEAERAGEQLVEANLLLVVSIAERYHGTGVHMLNLIQQGNQGLMRALSTFPESPGDDFGAHAAACVERAIAEAARC